jgi:hypothetical protein
LASIYNDIRAALETHLSNVSGIPSVAYENVSFEPQTGTSFLQVMFLPTERRPAVRGLNPQQRYQGVFSILVHTPEGKGPKEADDYANTLLEAFEATTDISFTNSNLETINVSLDYAERQQGILDSPWYYVRVDIGWYIYK